MNQLSRNRLLRHSPLLSVVATVLLLLAGVTAAWLGERDFRDQKIEQASAHARVLAASVSAALAFQDADEAQRAVDLLYANPEVEAVGVYTEQGVLFAGRSSSQRHPPARAGGLPPQAYSDDFARATAEVTQDQTSLGSVYVELSTDAGPARWMRYAGVALLLVMASVMIALVATAQRALSAANEELERRADELIRTNARLTNEIAERQKAQNALTQAQKMEAIGQLTGGIAHDFNNLLMVIQSGLRMIQRKPDRIESVGPAIHQAVERGAGLTRQLLAFAGRQKLQPEAIDVKSLLQGMRQLLQGSLREDIEVDFAFGEGLCPVKIDPGQLELALLNLAVNARDAMPQGGRLLISTRYIPPEAGRENEPGEVQIAVSDNGLGMSADVLDRAFDPFFTTKGPGAGTGLGLSQVYGFAHQSGGRCDAESEPGIGTTVTLTLPCTSESPRVCDVVKQGEAVRHGGGAILVVEDEPNVATLVCEMMRDLGYEPTHVGDARAALAALADGAKVDLVFSDVIMPGGMSGIDLARELRERRPELPIVLTTGYGGRQEIETSGIPVVRKPYDIDQLGRALAAAIVSPRTPPPNGATVQKTG